MYDFYKHTKQTNNEANELAYKKREQSNSAAHRLLDKLLLYQDNRENVRKILPFIVISLNNLLLRLSSNSLSPVSTKPSSRLLRVFYVGVLGRIRRMMR